jgi:hypothetical protein
MKNEIMKHEMSLVGTQLLRIPLQTAPVERTLAAAPPLVGQDGVVPSVVQNWMNLLQPPIYDNFAPMNLF